MSKQAWSIRSESEGRPVRAGSRRKDSLMKQYLLSVHLVEGQEPPPPEVIEQSYRDVDAFNSELQASGAWVFAGGLYPPSTATGVRVSNGEVLTTDGPFAETKEQLGGFWVIQAEDL